jgi:hypothetical protein
MLANNNQNKERTHRENKEALVALNCHHAHLADKVKKARLAVSEI